eukprot:Awhi_evm1s7696
MASLVSKSDSLDVLEDAHTQTKPSTSTTVVDKDDLKFQKKTGWYIFFSVLLGIMLLNIPFIVLTFNIREGSILQGLAKISYGSATLTAKSKLYATKNASGTITNDELLDWATLGNASKALQQDVVDLHADGKQSYNYALASGIIHIVLTLGVIVYVVGFKRKSKVIKSRGVHFLAHLFVAVIIALVMALCLSAVATLQIKAYDPFVAGSAVYKEAYFSFGFLTVLSGHNLFCAMVSRSRLVYLAFNVKTGAKKKSLTAFTYWEIFPIHFFMALIMGLTLTIYTFGSFGPNATKWKSMSMIPVQIIYLMWTIYYTWHCRHANIEYSDIYINLRCTLVINIFLIGATLIDNLTETMLDGVLFQYAFQGYALTYIIDQFSSLAFLEYNIDQRTKATSNSQNSRSKTTCTKSNNALSLVTSMTLTHEYSKSLEVYDGEDEVDLHDDIVVEVV